MKVFSFVYFFFRETAQSNLIRLSRVWFNFVAASQCFVTAAHIDADELMTALRGDDFFFVRFVYVYSAFRERSDGKMIDLRQQTRCVLELWSRDDRVSDWLSLHLLRFDSDRWWKEILFFSPHRVDKASSLSEKVRAITWEDAATTGSLDSI